MIAAVDDLDLATGSNGALDGVLDLVPARCHELRELLEAKARPYGLILAPSSLILSRLDA